MNKKNNKKKSSNRPASAKVGKGRLDSHGSKKKQLAGSGAETQSATRLLALAEPEGAGLTVYGETVIQVRPGANFLRPGFTLGYNAGIDANGESFVQVAPDQPMMLGDSTEHWDVAVALHTLRFFDYNAATRRVDVELDTGGAKLMTSAGNDHITIQLTNKQLAYANLLNLSVAYRANNAARIYIHRVDDAGHLDAWK